jgi:hypothetical protein
MALGRQEEPGTVGERSGRGGEEPSSVQQGEGGGGAGGGQVRGGARGGQPGERLLGGGNNDLWQVRVFTHGGLFIPMKLTCRSTQNHRLVVNSQRLVNLSTDNLN